MTDPPGDSDVDTALVTTVEVPCSDTGNTLRAAKSGEAADLTWPDAPGATTFLLIGDDHPAFAGPRMLSCHAARAHLDTSESGALVYFRVDALDEACASGLR